MSLWKKGRAVDVVHVEGKMETEKYVYTPGIAGLKLAEALIEGRILGVKCGEEVYVPAKAYCPDHSEGEMVEVKGPWVIKTYTIVYEDMYGSKVEPRVVAVIAPEGAKGGLIHYVNIEPRRARIGLKVEPVFRPKEERRGLLTDIMYFKPVEE